MAEFKFIESGWVVFEIPTGAEETPNKWKTIRGWFNYASAYEYALNIKFHNKENIHIVECGCWLGASTSYLAKIVEEKRSNNLNIKFDILDTFKGYDTPDEIQELSNYKLLTGEESFEKVFRDNMTEIGLLDQIDNIHVIDPLEGHNLYEDNSLDFVFFDAWKDQKGFDCMKRWWPKLKVGGIMGCDDYNSFDSVRDAVDEFFNDKKDQVNNLAEECENHCGDISARVIWAMYERIS